MCVYEREIERGGTERERKREGRREREREIVSKGFYSLLQMLVVGKRLHLY